VTAGPGVAGGNDGNAGTTGTATDAGDGAGFTTSRKSASGAVEQPASKTRNGKKRRIPRSSVAKDALVATGRLLVYSKL
jgi:hypothetical protein